VFSRTREVAICSSVAAGDLADAVRTGRYSPDERLPTLVSLAIANQVHPRTMSRVLRRLRQLGYVTYRQGYGYFVSHPTRLRIAGQG
jgi:DNA-binding transcriptional regulator YhcF (GntR family)